MRGEEAGIQTNPRGLFLSLMWAFDSVKTFLLFDTIISPAEIIKAETNITERASRKSNDTFRAHERLPLRMGKGWRRHRNDNVISSWLPDHVPEMVAHTVSLLGFFWHSLAESHLLLCRMSRFNCSRQESTEALLSQSDGVQGG